MQQRAYKAVFFDLDGTLLPMDLAKFLARYFEEIGAFLAARGYEPDPFIKGINEGMRAMVTQPNAGTLNEVRFWEVFCDWTGTTREEFEPLLLEFYATGFGAVSDSCYSHPAAEQILATLDEKGYTLFLTTMPLFPPSAVIARLGWAQCKPEHFTRITTYDNSTSCKPHLQFFEENLAIGGFKPEEVLMVGNNTNEDLSAMRLGIDGYLVTDFMIDPTGEFSLDSVKHGSLDDLLAFVQELPRCE